MVTKFGGSKSMLKDTKGNRLYRKVDIRIFFPERIFPPRHLAQHAPAHKGFNGENIDDILMQVVDKLDVLYPWWEFKMIELASVGRTARYVFTFAGYKAGAIAGAAPTSALADFAIPGMANEV
jgi:hypothetical protein